MGRITIEEYTERLIPLLSVGRYIEAPKRKP